VSDSSGNIAGSFVLQNAERSCGASRPSSHPPTTRSSHDFRRDHHSWNRAAEWIFRYRGRDYRSVGFSVGGPGPRDEMPLILDRSNGAKGSSITKRHGVARTAPGRHLFDCVADPRRGRWIIGASKIVRDNTEHKRAKPNCALLMSIGTAGRRAPPTCGGEPQAAGRIAKQSAGMRACKSCSRNFHAARLSAVGQMPEPWHTSSTSR